MLFSARTPAGLATYFVIASAAALGSALATGEAQAHTPANAQAAAKPTVTAAKPAPAAHHAAPAAAKPAAAKPAAAKPTEHAKAPAAKPQQKTYADNLDGWIAQARDILAADGDKVPSAASVKARAMTESSGNPLAQNHWDGNQALYGGTYGLIQTIKPTFNEWSLPGHKDILNPVDSIIAGVRYANDRYGSFETIAYGSQGY
ncbi:transglycosylase SLT domain-containing protein [Streptacidiphilus sp. EB129]|uniref:transglycosylase SLT domain-containing protein n=1 Tax=Streptacidiphilus sp. EB129 TaxID=3156262 RepID=UPI003517F5F0